MKPLTYKNNTYYLYNGMIFDEDYVRVSTDIANEILENYYQNLIKTTYSQEELLTLIKSLKNDKLYDLCISAIDLGLKKFYGHLFCATVFPIKTSCLRLLGRPQEAIDFWNTNCKEYYYCKSSALFTSLAAAYCDIKDYETAKKYANIACAISGGPNHMERELINVYRRLKFATNNIKRSNLNHHNSYQKHSFLLIN